MVLRSQPRVLHLVPQVARRESKSSGLACAFEISKTIPSDTLLLQSHTSNHAIPYQPMGAIFVQTTPIIKEYTTLYFWVDLGITLIPG